MSLPTKQYPPPGTWEEFESLCADLYERLWKDPSTQRHGRQGQPQGGVDVYGRPDGENYTGVQCKKKEIWPPKELTTDEIDEEVEKAKTWDPGLKHFIIATTAPNDDKAQAHARALTEKHKKKGGLFSVTVASWNEITRRLGAYPELLRAYGYLPDLAQLSQETSTTIADETARRVIQALGNTQAIPQPIFPQEDAEDEGLAEALERDLAARYDRAMRRSFFPEAMATDEYASVADVACEPPYAAVKTALRRTIILRAARSAAVRKSIQKAEELLAVAQTLAGGESDRLARARILEARGDVDGALVLIRDQKDADSRSTLLNMLFRHRGPDAALKAFADQKLSGRDLTINGLQTVAAAYLQNEDFDGLRERLDEISTEQLSQGPYFRFLRAMVNVATLLPVPDRELAFRSFQMDARHGRHSVLDAATTAARLDLAIGDLTALLPIAAELELQHAKRLAEGYLRWCELLHPHRKDAGLEHLRSEMQDLATAKERLSLAFAFDPKFDPQPIQEYLNAREELGGLDDDDLKATLIIRIHSDDPASVAALIAQHRARFETTYKDPPIFTIELQALALAGDTASAWLLLDKHRADLTPEGVAGFEALIKKSEGNDPVVEDLKVYEQTKSPEALRALVSSLAGKKDHRAIAKYSEELYAQSSDPHDIARAAQAFGRLGDDTEFLRVMEAHPTLKEREPGLLHYYAWALFRKGRLKDAKAAAEALGPAERDLQLEVAIAIESGEWESLAKPLAAYLDDASKHSGLALIRAAHIAQQSGHGPFMDLVKAAIAKAGDNPHVWLGAYTAILDAGLEEEVPESHEWFRRAMAHSGKKGPVQQFELRDLVPQQVEWNKRTADISERVNKAEVPLVIAAPGLRMTVVDMLLRNLVRNSGLDDARRKYVIPLFSGHRPPERVGPTVSNLGLDISGLLVLGWLGLLPKVFAAFTTIALPATILTELFNGRERVQHVQKSRIKRARELEQAILRSRIKIARPVENAGDPLSNEVGPSLAALIQSAAESGGTVLRPGPVHRPGLEQKPADVTSQLAHLADMHALLKVLVEKGAVNQTEEETAKGYFNLQDKGLPGCVEPDLSKPLFIDELALVYLQGTDLLDAVLKVFKDVRIEGSSEDEALALIEHHQHIEEVLNIIDDIRNLIRAANASGKVQFGPRRNERGKRAEETPSTLHLLSDLTAVDAVVCDDRALNKENFAADTKGKRIPCLSTLDVLEELRGRGKLSDAERISARHKLRVGGAALVPVDLPEVLNALGRSHKAMSAEMRAIQESIDLARVAEIPIFPRELRWYASVSMGVKAAVIPIWKTVPDAALAGRLSNMVMHVIPKPEDWASRWDPEPPPGWVDAVNTVVIATLAVPIELNDAQTEAAYNEWFERHHLEPLRAVWPERYRAVVEQVRAFILDDEDKDGKKQEEGPKSGQRPEPTQAASEKASRAHESNGKAKTKGKGKASRKGRR
jgi:hypothetical protein